MTVRSMTARAVSAGSASGESATLRMRRTARTVCVATLAAAAILVPAGAVLAHGCDRTDNDRAEASRAIRAITREIDAMERAIVEALRLQTGQLSGYTAQSTKAITQALDAQTRLRAQTDREVEETRSMRAHAPSRSACSTVTGVTGLAATRSAAENARKAAGDVETGRIVSDRAVVGEAGSAADGAARFDTVTNMYCSAGRAGDATCRGEDAWHGADLKPATLLDRRTFDDEARTSTPPSSSRATSPHPWSTTRCRWRPPRPTASAGWCCWRVRRTRGRRSPRTGSPVREACVPPAPLSVPGQIPSCPTVGAIRTRR